MIVLDTTVLAYSMGSEHRFRDPCRNLIGAIEAGEVRATTTPEVVQEFCHVRARRRGRDDAASLAGAFAELLSPLVAVDRAALDRGLGIFAATPALGAFDSVLAAVALEAEAAMVSADRAFADISGLRVIQSVGDGVAALLRG